jgi:hypothetical protein
MQGLMLDAAFPPSPDQWVADMNSVGASVGAVYVYGPAANYSQAHVAAARSAGKMVLPIIVPGNAPPPPPLYGAAEPYGIISGPLIYDVETGSLPGLSWIDAAISAANVAGWNAGTYCTEELRASYPPGWWWRAGTGHSGGGYVGVYPPPAWALAAGASAQQYDYDVRFPSGAHYDVSVVDLALWGLVSPPASAVEEVEMRVLTARRPDGGSDVYCLLPSGAVERYVTDANGNGTGFADAPSGTYIMLTLAGYRNGGAYVQGIGTDNNPYETYFDGQAWQVKAIRR